MLYFICIFSIFSLSWAEDWVVGTTSGYAPYVSLNDKAEYEGFDIDVAEAVAGKLGRKLVIKDFGSMPALILALKQGKADALIWAISITRERQKQMEMVYYQGERRTTQSLLFWKEVPDGTKGLVVSVEAGSFQENALLGVPGVTLKQVDKVSDAILELKYGKSKAALIDNSLVALYQKKFPELKVMTFDLPEDKQSMGNGICLKDKELALAVQKAVDELIVDGTIARLESKWKLKE